MEKTSITNFMKFSWNHRSAL